MRLKNLAACLFLGMIATSCIKDEAPNAEADIETCTVPGNILNREPIIGNNKVILPLKRNANITKIAPEFTLTAGATITPASGTERDFTTPQKYTVTSEDRLWTKEYEVTAQYSGIPTSYHFEEAVPYYYKENLTYYNFTETDGINRLNWANANEGFNYTGVEAAPQTTTPVPHQME